MRQVNQSIAVAYIRASTEEQRLGPAAQRDAIERWARAEGVTIAAWHEDLGVSGGADLDLRPGLVAALAEVRSLRAGRLVVAKRDRLARDAFVALAIERAAAPATIVSADGVANGDGPSEVLLRRILDAVSEYERAIIRARTRAALAARKRQGKPATRDPAYGWRLGDDGEHVELHPGEQSTIGRVLELRAEGRSLRAVVEALGAEGHTGRTGRPLGLTQVARIERRARAEADAAE